MHQSLQNGIGRIPAGGNAKIDGQFLRRIVLAERRGETFIEVRFETLDRTNDGDVRDLFRNLSLWWSTISTL